MKTPVKSGDDKKNAGLKTDSKKLEKVKTQTVTVGELLNPTAEQRIRRIKNFQVLAEKHDFLKTKIDELENFILSSDGTKEKITLSNGSNFHFQVSNSQVIEEVLELLKKRLIDFFEKSEKEILEYSI